MVVREPSTALDTQTPEPTTLQQIWNESRPQAISSEAVYATLRKAIVEGVLAASDRLGEEALAATFGVSRTPVREALFRLEAERLAIRVPRLGLVVAGISPQETVEIYAVRQVLEGLAARLAAQSVSPAELDHLDDLTNRLAEATAQGEIRRMFDLSLDFHEAICRAGRNSYLLSLIEDIHSRIRRIRSSTLSYPGRAEETLAQHRELLAALQRRDADAAETIARRHMEGSLAVRQRMNK